MSRQHQDLAAALVAAVQEAKGVAALVVPARADGWLPTPEIARQLGLSNQAATARLHKLERVGLVERRLARQNGVGGNMNYWRLLPRRATPKRS